MKKYENLTLISVCLDGTDLFISIIIIVNCNDLWNVEYLDTH